MPADGLQVSNITRLFDVTGNERVRNAGREEPTDLERVQSFIYWAARARGRRKLFKGSGHINQRAIAAVMGIDPGHFSRILSGQNSPWGRRFIDGLGRLAGTPDGPMPDHEVLYRIRADFRPFPAAAFAKYAKQKAKSKKRR